MCLRRVWRERKRKEGREVRQRRTRRGVREKKGRGAQGGKEGREMKDLATSLRWKALCTLFLSQSHLQESWASSFVYKGRKRGDLWWEMWLITTSWQPGNGNNLILMVSFPYHTQTVLQWPGNEISQRHTTWTHLVCAEDNSLSISARTFICSSCKRWIYPVRLAQDHPMVVVYPYFHQLPPDVLVNSDLILHQLGAALCPFVQLSVSRIEQTWNTRQWSHLTLKLTSFFHTREEHGKESGYKAGSAVGK